MSLGRIEAISVVGQFLLALVWDDGHRANVDFAALIARRPNLSPLADPGTFGAAMLAEDGWSVEWPMGIDFGAAQLRRWADEQAGEVMAADALRGWMAKHDLTLDRAAAALGLSRRTIAYYVSGEQVIPKTVLLATEGYDSRMAA